MRETEHHGHQMEQIEGDRDIKRHIAQEAAKELCRRRSIDSHRVNSSVFTAPLLRCTGQNTDSEHNTLLKYQHYDTGHDKRGKSLRGVAEHYRLALHRHLCHTLRQQTYIIDGLCLYLRTQGQLNICQSRNKRTVPQHKVHLGIEHSGSLLSAPEFTGVIGRNLQYAVHLMAVHQPARGLHVRHIVINLHSLRGVHHAYQLTALLAAAVVNNSHRHIHNHLRVIYKRIYHRIAGRKCEEEEHDSDI